MSSSSPAQRPRWLGLAGPTASGKTAAALALAAELPVEIVSVDSALVYRGMDIGTAKPSRAERAAAPHHLIDLIEPTGAYSAAQFVADATRLIGEIAARGRLPLLVGGTMLYFKALIDGIDALPAADPAVRAALEAEAAQQGWPALHAELARVDAATAARLAPNDAQRIQRALEVWRVSGQPLSAFHTERFSKPTPAADDWALVSLEPAERGWLHRRIGERFAQMIEDGLIDEVKALRERGDLHAGLPAMRAVGYRQAWEALDAEQACGRDTLDAAGLALLHERGSAATRQLAKRQLTWLRSMPQRLSVACDAGDAPARTLATLVAQARRLELA